MRDCENCKNYKENERGYKGCCKWECEYESKDVESPGVLIGYFDGEPVYRFGRE